MNDVKALDPLEPENQISAYYQVFRNVSRSVHSSRSLKDVLELVVVKSTQVLSAKGALLRIHNEEKAEFEVAAAMVWTSTTCARAPYPATEFWMKPAPSMKSM